MQNGVQTAMSIVRYIVYLLLKLVCLWTKSLNMTDPDARIKRRRGPTKLANVENLPEGVKIIVKLDRFNAPCSQSSVVLGSYLGTLVRKPHLAPLNILKWNDKLYKRIYHPKLISEVQVLLV